LEDENLKLFSPEEMPQTDEAKKEKVRVNCLSEILREVMYERKIEAVDIHKATGISYSTLSGWMLNGVNSQLADKNLLELGKFLNLDLYYLLFGIGTDDPHFKDFATFNDNEGKQDGV
jgi:transcriptional regulator with XRE-family HTH domain